MKVISDERSNVTPGMRVRLVQPDHIDYPFLVTIAVPAAPPPDGGYHAAISTDANTTGGSVNQAFAYPSINMELPQTVVVSAGYPLDVDPPAMLARNTELTPTPWPEWDESYAKLLGGTSPVSGRADAFRDFLCDELKPAVAAEYGIDPDQWSLIGHSLGGLFATHCALTRPAEFRRYLAVGSSYWWRGREIFARAKAFAGHSGGTTRAIYIAAGTGESAEALEADWQKYMSQPDWRDYIALMGGFPDIWGDSQRMALMLGSKPGFAARFESIDDETHGSAVLTALSRGLRWLHDATAKE